MHGGRACCRRQLPSRSHKPCNFRTIRDAASIQRITRSDDGRGWKALPVLGNLVPSERNLWRNPPTRENPFPAWREKERTWKSEHPHRHHQLEQNESVAGDVSGRRVLPAGPQQARKLAHVVKQNSGNRIPSLPDHRSRYRNRFQVRSGPQSVLAAPPSLR